ncbi:LOW QUALITY PROTEIN: uncharacterized protein LOC119486715 [Sebastes umbrosus]|uniref:LOW QUALITY PROTEIN: uncharacterized protein LOC119486715 n=1 Tax=Sebastes umbrosus TaxID=72105 RepID=UPI0018A0C9B1|nr:LOW QUALITY PROTEIN: uncharacterized protein LOC119486715 [Sebastes umbrosus]
MADYDLDPFLDEPDLSANVPPEPAPTPLDGRRRSTRMAMHCASPANDPEALTSLLHDHSIVPAPGLHVSQLQELATHIVNRNPGEQSPSPSLEPAAPSNPPKAPAQGRKRAKKSGPSQAPQAKSRNPTVRNPSPAAIPGPSNTDITLISTLQSLANSIQTIDVRLQSLEHASATAASSATIDAAQAAMLQHTLLLSQPSTATPNDSAQHSLASAVQVPPLVFRTNPLGIATRKYSGKKRLISDLSAPRSGPYSSINSLIPPKPFSLHYASVDNAIKLIKLAGQGAQLSKADITDAFKIFPIHLSHWHLFSIRWNSKFYFGVRLTFGCRSSPFTFNQVSEALCWILLNRVKVPSVLHLLDDFLLIDPPHDKYGSLPKLKQCLSSFGIPLSEEKTTGPDTRLEFLGITLDSIEMKASLPVEKMRCIRDITKSFCASENITKQQLLSLLGHLNFAMRVIPQGRSFISRILDMAYSVPQLHDLISLDEGCRSDLQFWSLLLDHWNGVTFFYDELVHSSDALNFFMDAAPSVGFGGFFQGEWFASHWPPSFSQLDSSSALYEIYPVAVACHVWGHHWKRKRITVLCDNIAVVGIINRGHSPLKDIMPFMRSITWSSVIHNFIITARHVPGHFNSLADSLSRYFTFGYSRWRQPAGQVRQELS